MEDIFLSEAIHNILFIFILFALQCFLASRNKNGGAFYYRCGIFCSRLTLFMGQYKPDSVCREACCLQLCVCL